MNAPVTAQADEVQKIEAALDALLKAAIHYLGERSLDPRDDEPMNAVELSGRVLDKMTWTNARRDADDLLTRPVSTALRKAIRTLGKRVNEIGGWPLMQEVCDRVSQLDPANESRRLGIIDHRWDGIGDWFA